MPPPQPPGRRRYNILVLLNCLQDVVRQQFVSLLVHAAGVVVRAGDHNRHVERRKDRDLVPAVAAHVVSRAVLPAGLERLQPPQIPVFGLVVDLGMRLSRYFTHASSNSRLTCQTPPFRYSSAILRRSRLDRRRPPPVSGMFSGE